MTGFVRKATLLGVMGLFVASAAMASVPDPAHSTVPGWLSVVGNNASNVADPRGIYCVTIRDFANNPISGVNVELDLSSCCDINICTDVIAGQTLKSCTPPKISRFTDAAGVACFTITGAAKDAGTYANPNATNGAQSACVRLKAGTTDFGLIAQALAYDQNGVIVAPTGVNTLDLSVLLALIKANTTPPANTHYRSRANYSGPGLNDLLINTLDISFFFTVNKSNQSAKGCVSGTYCTTKVPGPNCP